MVEQVSTKQRLMCLAQEHNAVTLVKLEPTTPLSPVKHSATEPLRILMHCFVSFLVLQSLSFWCLVIDIVLSLFLTVPWVGLQCVIMVFPDHTHLL